MLLDGVTNYFDSFAAAALVMIRQFLPSASVSPSGLRKSQHRARSLANAKPADLNDGPKIHPSANPLGSAGLQAGHPF